MSADLQFENLVRLYYRDLYRFGFSLTGNEADAADLTQETFYIWANKGHQLQKAASVKSWLFTTLHREFLKTCRHRNAFLKRINREGRRICRTFRQTARSESIRERCFVFLGEIAEDFRAPLWCSITWKICPTKKSPMCLRFHSGPCSRVSRARKFSFCAG